MSIQNRAEVAAARARLLSGQNPVEVCRQVHKARVQHRLNKCIGDTVESGKQRILHRLLIDQLTWSKALQTAATNQVRSCLTPCSVHSALVIPSGFYYCQASQGIVRRRLLQRHWMKVAEL